jgi:hypothetical protein
VIHTNISLAPKFKSGVANTVKVVGAIAIIGLAVSQYKLYKTVEHKPTAQTATVSVTLEPTATPSAVVTPTIFVPNRGAIKYPTSQLAPKTIPSVVK